MEVKEKGKQREVERINEIEDMKEKMKDSEQIVIEIAWEYWESR